MLTDEQLKAIREREQKATKGPWTDEKGNLCFPPWLMSSDFMNDLAFVAHARTDIPALLAEIDRLRRENEELERMGGYNPLGDDD